MKYVYNDKNQVKKIHYTLGDKIVVLVDALIFMLLLLTAIYFSCFVLFKIGKADVAILLLSVACPLLVYFIFKLFVQFIERCKFELIFFDNKMIFVGYKSKMDIPYKKIKEYGLLVNFSYSEVKYQSYKLGYYFSLDDIDWHKVKKKIRKNLFFQYCSIDGKVFCISDNYTKYSAEQSMLNLYRAIRSYYPYHIRRSDIDGGIFGRQIPKKIQTEDD